MSSVHHHKSINDVENNNGNYETNHTTPDHGVDNQNPEINIIENINSCSTNGNISQNGEEKCGNNERFLLRQISDKTNTEQESQTRTNDSCNNNQYLTETETGCKKRGSKSFKTKNDFNNAVLQQLTIPNEENVTNQQAPPFRRHRRCESATVSGCGGGSQRRESTTKLTHRRTRSNITTTTTFNCQHRNSSVVVVITKDVERAKKCTEWIVDHCKVFPIFGLELLVFDTCTGGGLGFIFSFI